MARLLRSDFASGNGAAIGGVPRAPAGTAWPRCRGCGAAMRFLARVPLAEVDGPVGARFADRALLLFQCDAHPGECPTWEAEGGANAALLVDVEQAVPLTVPAGETLLPAETRLAFEPYDDARRAGDPESDDSGYREAFDARPRALLRRPPPDTPRRVLGKLGGRPGWIQADETPRCTCGAAMDFVLQLEETGGGGMSFGDAGVAYAFVCRACEASARLLWQCA